MRDPSSETALSVSALHRTMLDRYRPAIPMPLPSFAADVARWGHVAGHAVDGDAVRFARMRERVMRDDAAAAYIEALATLAT